MAAMMAKIPRVYSEVPLMPLTDTAIRALKPKAKRYSRADERGLVLEVFPTGACSGTTGIA
jgi:hypothetical protein